MTTVIIGVLYSSPSVAPSSTSALVQGRRESGYNYVGYLISDKQKVCAATLVKPDLILTAGHCLSVKAGESFSFGLGEFSPDSEELAKVVQVKYANGFNFETDNGPDVAVAKLDKRFDLSLPLTFSSPSQTCGNSLVAYGSGIQKGAATADQFIKKSGEGCITNPTSTFLIEFSDEVGMCFGDSGGPIFSSRGNNELVGVLTGGLIEQNLGTMKCDLGNTGIGYSITPYLALINQFETVAAPRRNLDTNKSVTGFVEQFNKAVSAQSGDVILPVSGTNQPINNDLQTIANIVIYVATFVITLGCIYFLTKPLNL